MEDLVLDGCKYRKGSVGCIVKVDDSMFLIEWDEYEFDSWLNEDCIVLLEQLPSDKPTVGGTFEVICKATGVWAPASNETQFPAGTAGTVERVELSDPTTQFFAGNIGINERILFLNSDRQPFTKHFKFTKGSVPWFVF